MHGGGRLLEQPVQDDHRPVHVARAAMGLGAYAALHGLNALLGESSVLREGIGVIGAAVLGAGIYAGIMLLLRVPEIHSIWRIFTRRRVA